MTKRLTTQNATITTAAVEVKTLTISGKQVTLAVFRQLREEPLIAEDGTLNGVPWGYVNYHPDKCGDGAHWHIVWQRGSELLRSRVDYKAYSGKFWSETGDRFVSAHVREVLEGRGRYLDGAMPGFNRQGVTRLAHAGSFSVELARDEGLANAIREWAVWRQAVADAAKNPDSAYYAHHAERTKKLFARQLEELSSAPPEPREVDELYEALVAEIAQEMKCRQRHGEAREALAELPQLFIAV